MVILINCKKCGLLGNRLFLSSHIIAHAIEQKYLILNPAFQEYCDYFESLSNWYISSYPPAKKDTLLKTRPCKKYIRSIFYTVCFEMAQIAHFLHLDESRYHKILYWDNDTEIYNLSNPEFLEAARKKKIIFLGGWLIRDPAALDRNSDAVREYFSPRSDIRERINHFIERERSDGDFLIGIHIRRGDYKDWRGGTYYFSFGDYVEVMHQVKCALGDKNHRFIICSNEEIPGDYFTGLDCSFGPHTEIEDMYSLAGCDLIVGPPSSYSMWASFYGKVPLLVITNPHDPVRIADAKIIKGSDMHHVNY